MAPPRILLIDDEYLVGQLVQRALSPAYEVLALTSSEKLEGKVASFWPDLIILDGQMAYEDGWQLCSRLRREKLFEGVPVLFLSAMDDEVSVRKGFACGGNFYLPKPFDILDLAHIVDLLIRLSAKKRDVLPAPEVI